MYIQGHAKEKESSSMGYLPYNKVSPSLHWGNGTVHSGKTPTQEHHLTSRNNFVFRPETRCYSIKMNSLTDSFDISNLPVKSNIFLYFINKMSVEFKKYHNYIKPGLDCVYAYLWGSSVCLKPDFKQERSYHDGALVHITTETGL